MGAGERLTLRGPFFESHVGFMRGSLEYANVRIRTPPLFANERLDRDKDDCSRISGL